jgi:hypothetical protein
MRGSGVIQLDRPERKMEATNDWEIFYRRRKCLPIREGH